MSSTNDDGYNRGILKDRNFSTHGAIMTDGEEIRREQYKNNNQNAACCGTGQSCSIF